MHSGAVVVQFHATAVGEVVTHLAVFADEFFRTYPTLQVYVAEDG